MLNRSVQNDKRKKKWHRKVLIQVFTDTEGHELHVGDYVLLCGDIGKIVFSCGAFGIFIADEVPWDTPLRELVRKTVEIALLSCYNDNFISFWEIVWNLSEDTDESCLPYVESITATGGIFTDGNGNKDVFMGCINGCSRHIDSVRNTPADATAPVMP